MERVKGIEPSYSAWKVGFPPSGVLWGKLGRPANSKDVTRRASVRLAGKPGGEEGLNRSQWSPMLNR